MTSQKNKSQKNKIQQNFNLASLSYDAAANIQYETARILVNNLIINFPEFKPISILDIGTGTGYMPKLLLQKFPNSNYCLNDLAANMLEQTSKKLKSHKNIEFCLGDMENVSFNFHQLITSNMALQWSVDLNKLIKKLFNKSNILAFSCLLNGTFAEWRNICQKLSVPLPTYTYPEQTSLETNILNLQPKNYFFDTKTFNLTFANSLEFMQYLKNLGANTSKNILSFNNIKTLLNYKEQFNITYKIFFCIISK